MNSKKNNFETLKKEKDFNLVYEKGKSVKLKGGLVKAVYLFVIEDDKRKGMVAATVSSKLGNSVWRNRFKRLIREATRLENKTISEILDRKESNLLIVFSPHRTSQKNKKKLSFEETRSDVSRILKIISSEEGKNLLDS